MLRPLACAVCIAILTFGALAPGGAQPSPQRGGVMRVATNADPPGLDLMWQTSTISLNISQHVFETLLTLDAQKRIAPELAESYAVSNGGKTFTFKLRPGVKFHNGAEMTSADVLGSFQRWLALSSRARQILKDMTSATAPDKSTFVVELSQPNGAFLPALAIPNQRMVVFPKSVLDKNRDSSGKPLEVKGADLIGTGPYRLAEWKPDQYVRLVRFAGYASRPEPSNYMAGARHAYLDEIRFVPVPDDLTRVAGLISGEYDLALSLPGSAYDQLKANPAIAAQIVGPGSAAVGVFNKKRGLFVDVQVRRAAWLAVDPQKVMAGAFDNALLYRLTPALAGKEWGVWAFPNVGTDVYARGRDVAKAKDLLRETTYKGEPLRWITTRDYAYMYRSALVASDEMKEAGFNVRLVVSDWATVISDRNNPDRYEIFSTGIGFEGDPTSTAAFTPGWPGWYDSPRNNKNYEALVATVEPAKRRELAKDQQRLFWDEIPYLRFGEVLTLLAYRRSIQGMYPDNSYYLWNVWLTK